MGKWQDLFESRVYPEEDRECSHYAFNPPATREQIERLEEGLGFPLPADVRDMLSEFNGIRNVLPRYEVTLYFSTEDMLTNVSEFDSSMGK